MGKLLIEGATTANVPRDLFAFVTLLRIGLHAPLFLVFVRNLVLVAAFPNYILLLPPWSEHMHSAGYACVVLIGISTVYLSQGCALHHSPLTCCNLN